MASKTNNFKISVFLFFFILPFWGFSQKKYSFDEFNEKCLVKKNALKIIKNFEAHDIEALKKYIPNFNDKIRSDISAIYTKFAKKDIQRRNIPIFLSNSLNKNQYKRTYYMVEDGQVDYILQLDIEKVNGGLVLYLNGASHIIIENEIKIQILNNHGYALSNQTSNNSNKDYLGYGGIYIGDYLYIHPITFIVSIITGLRKRKIIKYLSVFYIAYFIAFKFFNIFGQGTIVSIAIILFPPSLIGFFFKKGDETWYSKIFDSFGDISKSSPQREEGYLYDPTDPYNKIQKDVDAKNDAQIVKDQLDQEYKDRERNMNSGL